MLYEHVEVKGDRLKTFFKYFIWFIIVFLIVDFFTFRVISSSFKKVSNGEVEESSVIELNNIECRATSVNGYIEGTLKNNTGNYINTAYMKLELLDEKDKVVRTQDIEVKDIKTGDEKWFKEFYKANDTVKYRVINIEYD